MNLINKLKTVKTHTLRPIVVTWRPDLHIGSTLSLCPPYVELDRGGSYKASVTQNWIMNRWRDFNKVVASAVKHHNAYLYEIFGGDVVEFHDKAGRIDTSKATIQKLATQILDPVIQAADECFFVRGTESHVGASACWEELLAADFDAVPDSETDMHSWLCLEMMADDVFIQAAHHRPMSHMPHTKAYPAGKERLLVIDEYHASGDRIPDVILRGHGHTFWRTYQDRPLALFGGCWKAGNLDSYVADRKSVV